MRRLRSSAPVGVGRYQPGLLVIQFLASRPGDIDRGPLAIMNSHEAHIRMLEDSELVWILGPRRKEIAPLEIDDKVPDGGVILRDIVGVTVSETVNVVKPDTDNRAV